MPRRSSAGRADEGPQPDAGRDEAPANKKAGRRRKGRRRSDVSESDEETEAACEPEPARDRHGHAGAKAGGTRRQQDQTKCYFCGRRGHTRAECPDAHGGRGSAKHKGRKERGQKAKGKDAAEEPAAPAAPECEFPFVDACCCLHGCFARANYYGPAAEFLESRGLQDACDRVVAVFADAACMAQSSDRYRCWEEMLAADRIVAAFGCWPAHAEDLEGAVESRLGDWVSACGPKVVGLVGGLDYSPQACSRRSEEEEEEARAAQRRVLGAVLTLAHRSGLPVILSCCGGAEKDLAQALKDSALPPETSRLLLADFSGDADFLVLRLMRDWPLMSIGFDGRLSFTKASHVRGLLFDVPLERLMLQSSAPDHLPASLSPASHHREGFSHPAVVPAVGEKVAELKDMPLEEVMEQARANARALFGV